MDDGYSSLPSSHLLGSVPAVTPDDKTPAANEGPNANMQTFPPGSGGYQAPGSLNGGNEQPATNWRGVFSISSYSPYFNVDTDVVMDRIISSIYPLRGDFSGKIDANPDLYGPIWISTTLVFILASLGNCASYLMHRKTDSTTAWNFDVTYVNWAASVTYGYVLLLPAALYFLLQYFGSNASLVRLWCIWGYSLFIFIPASLLLVVPVEVFRWIIIILSGFASAYFLSSNLRSYTEGNDLMVLVVSVFLLQCFLAILIKVLFFA
uniref:Protein YIP n=1 Tax=Anthurium amnicola TaxID=1678845 RepID=A0A1D1ZBA1_9ARAE